MNDFEPFFWADQIYPYTVEQWSPTDFQTNDSNEFILCRESKQHSTTSVVLTSRLFFLVNHVMFYVMLVTSKSMWLVTVFTSVILLFILYLCVRSEIFPEYIIWCVQRTEQIDCISSNRIPMIHSLTLWILMALLLSVSLTGGPPGT